MREYAEDKVQQNIVFWLKLKGFTFTCSGAGLIKSIVTQKIFNLNGYWKGSADLMVFIPNGCLHIECKRSSGFRWSNKLNRLVKDTQGGKQSEAQKLFQKRIEQISGHKYIVVSCLDEVIKFIEENNIEPY